MGILDSAGKTIANGGNVVSGLFPRKPEKPSIRWDDFPNGLVLTEIVNGVHDDSTAFKLNGNFRPQVPFVWGGTQRKVVDYYAGNPEPVVHIIGSQESDVTIKGRFQDKKLKSKDFRGMAYEYSEKLDTLRIKGALLHIELGEWSRYGFIESSKFEMKHVDDISYEITFTIISFTMPRSSPVIGEVKTLPFSINDQLLSAVEDFNSTYSATPTNMPTSISDEINGLVSEFASFIAGVTTFVDKIMTEIEQVQTSVNRGIGLVKVAQKSNLTLRRRLGSLRIGTRTLTSSIPDKYATAAFVGAAISSTHSISSILAALRARLQAIAQTVPMARHKVQSGETLQKISIKYYGTSENWKLIYDHNSLTSTALTSGAVLEIPRPT